MRELPLVEAMMIWLPIFWSPDGGGFNVSAARPPPVESVTTDARESLDCTATAYLYTLYETLHKSLMRSARFEWRLLSKMASEDAARLRFCRTCQDAGRLVTDLADWSKSA